MKTALTIGFFDGVHIGHQALLKRLRQKPHATILTFANHPLSVIRPPAPDLIIPYEERIALLKTYADVVKLMSFTEELAATQFDALLDQFDIASLLLGKGSVFGKNREGNEENVRIYAASRGIEVEYIPKLFFEGEAVSSSRIRKALLDGNTLLVRQLLGRL